MKKYYFGIIFQKLGEPNVEYYAVYCTHFDYDLGKISQQYISNVETSEEFLESVLEYNISVDAACESTQVYEFIEIIKPEPTNSCITFTFGTKLAYGLLSENKKGCNDPYNSSGVYLYIDNPVILGIYDSKFINMCNEEQMSICENIRKLFFEYVSTCACKK